MSSRPESPAAQRYKKQAEDARRAIDAGIAPRSTPPAPVESAAQGRDELWLSSKVGHWIWSELNAGRSVAAVTRELAERVKEMEARRAAL